MRLKSKWMYWNTIPCHSCGSRNPATSTSGEQYVECHGWHLCEYSVDCGDCGASINYWAYGGFQEPETYTEQFYRDNYELIQYRIKPWLKGFWDRPPKPSPSYKDDIPF